MGSTPPEVIWSSDVAQRPASLSAPAPHCGCVQSSSTLTPHLVSNFPPWSRESKSYIQRWGFQGGQNSSAAVLSWSLLQLVRTPLANTCSLNNESGFFFSYIFWPCGFRLQPSASSCPMHFEGEDVPIQTISVWLQALLFQADVSNPYSWNQPPSFSHGFLIAFAPHSLFTFCFLAFQGFEKVA